MLKNCTLATLALLAGTAFAPAFAATIPRTQVVMATGACQSALPVFDGVVRKRPLAVQNEGTSATFITCGLEGIFGATPNSLTLFVALTNASASAATVSCTLVDGRNNIADPIFLPKSLVVAANTPTTQITWSSTENSDVAFIYPAISCNVPPGIGIKAVGRSFEEEIGS